MQLLNFVYCYTAIKQRVCVMIHLNIMTFDSHGPYEYVRTSQYLFVSELGVCIICADCNDNSNVHSTCFLIEIWFTSYLDTNTLKRLGLLICDITSSMGGFYYTFSYVFMICAAQQIYII